MKLCEFGKPNASKEPVFYPGCEKSCLSYTVYMIALCTSNALTCSVW